MSKVYDITSKIELEKPVVKIGEKVFEVNDDFKVVMSAQSAVGKESDQTKVFDTVFTKLLGEKQAKELDEMHLSAGNVKTVFLAVMAAATGEELETVEARFQQQIKAIK
jgi:hypothetical protein